MRKILTCFLFFATALGLNAKQYCHEQITNGDNTVYLTFEKLSDTRYQIVIEADVEMAGLGGSFCEVNGVGGWQLNAAGHYTLSADKKTITCPMESNVAPRLYTPLYVMMPGEVNFGEFNDVEWGTCNTDETEYTITLTQPQAGGTIAADLSKAKYGTIVTLTATPDQGKQLDAWEVKDAAGNTVAVSKAGQFIMPASNVTVTAAFKDLVNLTPVTWYGSKTEEVADFDWSITRNADQTLTLAIAWDKDIEGVAPQVTVGNVQFAGMALSGNSAAYTTDDTFEDGDKPLIFFYIAYTGNAVRIDVDYTVGEGNAKPGSDAAALDNFDAQLRKARKVVENGIMYIERDGVRYTVQGTGLKK